MNNVPKRSRTTQPAFITRTSEDTADENYFDIIDNTDKVIGACTFEDAQLICKKQGLEMHIEGTVEVLEEGDTISVGDPNDIKVTGPDGKTAFRLLRQSSDTMGDYDLASMASVEMMTTKNGEKQ